MFAFVPHFVFLLSETMWRWL